MNLIQKAKDFLIFDIKEDKYALVDDPIFGMIAKDKAPEKWQKGVALALDDKNYMSLTKELGKDIGDVYEY